MASFLDILLDYDAESSPQGIAAAFAKMNEEMKKQEGAYEDQQWNNKFAAGQAQGVAPGEMFDPQTGQGAPEGMSPIDRWRTQIDAMMASENPALQKKGLEMLSAQQQRATSPKAREASQPAMSTAGKMAVEMGLTPGTPEFNHFIQSYAFKQNRQYAPKYVTPAEAKSIQWVDKNNKDPLVGQNWEDIRGQVRKTDEGMEMRDNASAVIDTLEDALFNPQSGIYNDEVWQGEGAAGVIAGGLAGAVKDVTQNDPRYKAFSDVRAGSAAQIVRAMGEKGALSDKDIERALALLPNISGFRGMPDLPETAQSKLSFLRTMLRIDPKEWAPMLDMAEQSGLIEKPKETKSDMPAGAVGVIE